MKFSKRILITSLTLVLMVVALGVGVFAWFTMNTRTKAGNLTGTAEAGKGGFYISLDGTNWLDIVDLDDIKNEQTFKFVEFTDLTTKVDDLTTLVDSKGLDDDGTGYIEFELYFLGGEHITNIHLTKLTFSDSDLTTWKAEDNVEVGDRIVEKGNVMGSYLSNAIRVSIEDALKGTVNIFEKGETVDNMTADPKVFGNTLGFGTETGNFAVAYYDKIMIKEQNLVIPDERGDQVIVADGDNVNHVKVAEMEEISNINPEVDTGDDIDDSFSHYGKIIVKVWVEGWDQEAFNAVLDGTVTINFEFDLIEDSEPIEP